VILSKPGAQIQNARGTADRGTSQKHGAGGATRAAPEGPQKRGKSYVFTAVLARLRQYFGPGIVSLASFLLMPIKGLLLFFRKGYPELGY